MSRWTRVDPAEDEDHRRPTSCIGPARRGPGLRTFGYDKPELFPYLRIEDTEISVVIQYGGGSEAVWGSNWDSSTLAAGDELDLGDRRRSPDGRCAGRQRAPALPHTGAEPLFSYDPAGRQAARMQGDRNLVVYGDREDRTVAVFDTGTRVPGTSLVVQNDRNLVLRGPGGAPVWSSFTGRLR